MKYRVAFVSIMPSPYQRDLFAALACRDEIDLRVHYLDRAAPDSPWPEKALRPFENPLPGFCLAAGGIRTRFNIPPSLRDCDIVVLNSLMDATAQWLMRVALRGRKWIFWGEKLRGAHSGAMARVHGFLCDALRNASGIAAIGRRAEADYAARYPGMPVFNIPYHCDLAEFQRVAATRAIRAGGPTFIFCGQMIARKGIDLLLEAFAAVCADHPEARLILVGREAELPGLLAKVPDDARARIEYAGFQAPENLPALFARADVFVLPSRYDGWGVVVNQALGAGLPIVCSDAVGAGIDLVEEGVNGCRFSNGDADALRDAMLRFADDADFLKSAGIASARMADDWTPERGAARWVEAIRETLDR